MPKARFRRRYLLSPIYGGILGGGASAIILAAPIAAWISDAATAQAVFEIDVPSGIVAGDTVYGEAYTDAGLTVLFDTEEATIQAGDIPPGGDGQIDDFAFISFTPDGTYCARYAIRRGGVRISPWSNTISETISTLGAGSFYQLLFAA